MSDDVAMPNLADLDDHGLAASLAEMAGVALVRLRDRLGPDDPKSLKDAGDRLSHDLLMEGLRQARPLDAVLSEEGKDDLIRLQADRVWIVDPLDGTREYSEPPRDDWAVHVALWEKGSLVAGAVGLPARGVTIATPHAQVSPSPVPTQPRIVVSRTRPPEEAQRVAAAIGGTLVPMGSAGAKAMAVLLGMADAYVHSGGQYEWDSAAPVVVAQAAGLHCSRIDGSPLVYNQRDTLLPDLVVCRQELAESVLAALK